MKPLPPSMLAILRSLAGVALVTVAMTNAQAAADVRVLLGIDPADTAGDVLLSASLSPSQSLSKATGMRTTITQTSTMAEVMRASRTVAKENITDPEDGSASAILHEYQLLATSGPQQVYALVARNG